MFVFPKSYADTKRNNTKQNTRKVCTHRDVHLGKPWLLPSIEMVAKYPSSVTVLSLEEVLGDPAGIQVYKDHALRIDMTRRTHSDNAFSSSNTGRHRVVSGHGIGWTEHKGQLFPPREPESADLLKPPLSREKIYFVLFMLYAPQTKLIRDVINYLFVLLSGAIVFITGGKTMIVSSV